MTYWPFYVGGLALFGAALVHWLLLGKLMSVSSRFSALVDRARGATPVSPEPNAEHLAFLSGIALGGLVAALVSGTFEPTLFEVGAGFRAVFGDDPVLTGLVLGAGGVLVGFGTRMATGCTSGHGLCGVARFERGSLLATAAFFGTGIVVALAVRELAS